MAIIGTQTALSKSGRSVVIRSAKRADAKSILAFGKSILEERIYSLLEPDELNLSIEQEEVWIEKMNQSVGNCILVAEVDGVFAGTLDFNQGHRKRIAHTGDFGMAIGKGFRSDGIGRLLLSSLLDWAEKHPVIEKVYLKVHSNNIRALALYQKLGFYEEGRLTRDLKYDDSLYVDTLILAKRFQMPKSAA